jgi:hypothetical protein
MERYLQNTKFCGSDKNPAETLHYNVTKTKIS